MAIPEMLQKALINYQQCRFYSDMGEVVRKSSETILFQQYAEFSTSFDREVAFEFSGRSRGARPPTVSPTGKTDLLGAWLFSYDWKTLLLSDPNGSREVGTIQDGIEQCRSVSLGASELIPNILLGNSDQLFDAYEFDPSKKSTLRGKNGDDKIDISLIDDSGLISLIRTVQVEHPRAASLALLQESMHVSSLDLRATEAIRRALEILSAQPEKLAFIETEYRFKYTEIR